MRVCMQYRQSVSASEPARSSKRVLRAASPATSRSLCYVSRLHDMHQVQSRCNLAASRSMVLIAS